MAPDLLHAERKLAAIMFTDIVGYTSLTQKDESLALELLEEHRQIVRPFFSLHGGKEIKTIGDAFLVEFSSALEAVRCAYEIQRSLTSHNLRSEPARKIMIRVGIHIGDIVYGDEGKDVYGNCVNIASRIEPLADPGGICVTGQVYDLARNSGDLTFENLGEHDLKNVEVPIGIFKVNLPWEEIPEVDDKDRRQRESLIKLRSSFFANRDAERAQLGSLLEKMSTSPVIKEKVVLIGGEAGVGKSRLVDWFIGETMQRGAYVARGYCQTDISIPYFPFSEALSKFLSEHQDRPQAGSISLANWLRTSAKTGVSYDSRAERDQMFEGTARLLARLSRKNLLLLCLEDIQWSDTATLALLHYLARNIADMNVLIVCTYRTEELADQLPGKPHPLKETLMLMSREGLYQRIELRRMDNACIRDIGASMLGAVSPEILDLLAKESEGNPLYAVEYARLLKGETHGQAIKKGGTLAEIPESIHNVILRRLSHLGPDERRLVDCASLIGERFEPQIISDALGLDRLSTMERLDRVARETRILREEEDGNGIARFFFDHAKIREVVSSKLSPSLGRELHRLIADVLFNEYHEERVEEIVFHYREGGMRQRVLELGPIAGDRARQRYANAEAVVYYDWALETAVSSDEKSVALRSQALIGRANAHYVLGLNEQALRDAQELLKETKDPSLRLQAIRICADSCFDMGHFTESLGFCRSEEVQKEQEKDSAVERLKIREIEAIITGYRGDPSAAIIALTQTAQELRALGERRQYAQILLSLKEFQLTMSDIAGASRSVEESNSIFSELGDLEGEMMASQSLAGSFLFVGDFASADARYARAAELGNKLGLYNTLTWIYLYWGFLHDATGNYEKALEYSLKALDKAKLSEIPYGETAVWANLTRCYIRANRMEDAENAYSQMSRLFQEHSKDASLTLQAVVQRTRGFYYATHGEKKLADSEYTSSIALVHDGPLGPFHETETRVEYARFLLVQGRIAEAETQLSEAIEIYKRLGNSSGIRKVQELLSTETANKPTIE